MPVPHSDYPPLPGEAGEGGRQPAPARPGGAASRRSTWCRVSRAVAETVRRIQPEPGCEIYPA